MKQLIRFYILAFALALSACVNTFYPLSDARSTIFNSGIEGKWKSREGNITIEQFSKSKAFDGWEKYHANSMEEVQDAYLVTIARTNDTSQLLGKLINLNGKTFMEIRPVENGYEYFGAYIIGRMMEIGQDKLSIAFADNQFIEQQLKEGRLRIAHETDTLFGAQLITAPTIELQRFVSKYANDQRLFNTSDPFILKR